MNEERKMILQMVQEGAISVEEAEQLLEAVPAGSDPDTNESVAVQSGPMPKRLRINVTEGGKNKMNMKVPFSLVRVGLKLGQTFGGMGAHGQGDNEQAARAFEMLKSIDIDELLASILEGEVTLPYTMLEAEDEKKGEYIVIVLE